MALAFWHCKTTRSAQAQIPSSGRRVGTPVCDELPWGRMFRGRSDRWRGNSEIGLFEGQVLITPPFLDEFSTNYFGVYTICEFKVASCGDYTLHFTYIHITNSYELDILHLWLPFLHWPFLLKRVANKHASFGVPMSFIGRLEKGPTLA